MGFISMFRSKSSVTKHTPLAPRGREAEMGTITVPDPLPSPAEDSEKLRKAFQGLGTNEKTIIEILGRRTAHQRSEISSTYHRLYNESLVQRLQSELSGDFGKAVILWALDPAERDAKLANEALRKKGHRHVWVIVEVACASSPDHLIAVRKAYCSLFATSLEEDIGNHFAQQEPLRKLLVHLVSSYRYDGDRVDELLAKSEGEKIYDAIRKKQPHHDDVLRILATRSKSQIRATFQHYKQNYGKAIDEDIESNSSKGDLFALMLKAAVLCLVSPEIHFSEVIRTSIEGLGTDEESLTRAIILRAETDMQTIKEVYKMRYKATVEADVIGDTSGYYKDFLLTLIGSKKKV